MKSFLIIFLLFCSYKGFSQNEFEGFFFGLDINYHYLFGGAQVEGKETVGEGNRVALGLSGGYRWQFDNDLVFGMEFQVNQPFGRLVNSENPAGALVDYFIKPQTALQFQFGKALGVDCSHLALAYFAINQTRFDIDIMMPDGTLIKQRDFENFGRVGIGYEGMFNEAFTVRFQGGTSLDALPESRNGIDTKLTFFYQD